MKLNPYLHFNGNCAEAFAFYEVALGCKIGMKMTYGEAPPESQGPPGAEHLIMHVSIDVGGTPLMGGDAPPGHEGTMGGFTVSLNFSDPAEAERIFAALSEGGVVLMPMAETFWSARFAMFADKFGVPWMIRVQTHKHHQTTAATR